MNQATDYFLSLCKRKTNQSQIWGFRGDYFFLSNFYPAKTFRYPTLEHAFVAAKTVSPTERDYILQLKTPSEAKKYSRTLTLRPNWEQIKLEVMETLLKEKFKDPGLRARLLATNDAELVEGNLWHDNYWGDCGCRKCLGIPGQNHLGNLLMKVREEMEKESCGTKPLTV